MTTSVNLSERSLPTYVSQRLSHSSHNIRPIFARHETFHPRYGWLKKGFDALSRDKELFTRDHASVVLGVGKNMVKSIRYWCFAFKLLDEVQEKGQRSRSYAPSQLGLKLLDEDGWDPYLEDPATLWLLHWHLLRAPCRATAWHFTFNHFHQGVFTADNLLSVLKDYSEQTTSAIVTESSLSKDIHCLLRMYTASSSSKVLKEDSLDCPFSEIGIIKHIDDAKHYTFNVGSQFGLPPEIVVAACLDFASSFEGSARTISISRLLYDTGGPGLIFKLSESFLCHSIDQVASKSKDVALSETAGLIQLSFSKDPGALKEQILNTYYRKVK